MRERRDRSVDAALAVAHEGRPDEADRELLAAHVHGQTLGAGLRRLRVEARETDAATERRREGSAREAAHDLVAPEHGLAPAEHAAGLEHDAEEAPEQVNGDPYGEGWFFRLRPTDAAELEELLDAAAYAEVAEQDTH
jgi:glycine cleavage system H protein